jgi:hypothetical protein
VHKTTTASLDVLAAPKPAVASAPKAKPAKSAKAKAWVDPFAE